MSGLSTSVQKDLGAIPLARGATILLRHGHREDLPPGEAGDEVPLSATGLLQATGLGLWLSARLGEVHTSPVLRCRQTGVAILHGAGRTAGRAAEPQDDRLLGAPGPFVLNGEVAWPVFQHHGAVGVAQLLRRGVPLPGLRPAEDGCVQLLRRMLHLPERPGRVDVHVSHDIIVALVAATLLQEEVGPLWPDFLEGVVLSRVGAGFVGCYRGRRIDVAVVP